MMIRPVEPDLLHNHLSIGMRPPLECPACDQLRVDMVVSVIKYSSVRRRLLHAAMRSG